jgi:hypothetical protein
LAIQQFTRLSGAIFVFVTLASNGVGASAAPLPSAKSIIAHYVDAIGGERSVQAVRSVLVKGRYIEGSDSFDAAMAKMKPYYKLVGDPDKRSKDFEEGYDGSAWEFYGDPGIVLRTVGAASAASRHGLYVVSPLANAAELGSTADVIGIEKVAGRPAYHLRLRMRDGFEEDEFVDAQNWLWVASRKVAPIHAFGAKVTSQTLFSDYRTVDGVRFPFEGQETDIASGKLLNEFKTTSIVVNRDFDLAVFSPPKLQQSPLQDWLQKLYAEREDSVAVLWSYEDFRAAHPGLNTDDAVEAIGYQILKMGDQPSAIALLERNAKAYPQSSGAAFGLGRAYRAANRLGDAKREFTRALALDPKNERAKKALSDMTAARSHDSG